MSGSAEKQPADARPAQRALTVGIETLGCRLNQFESDGVLSHFVASGRYRAVRPEDGPDIAIINTCTVTDHADTSNRKAVERARQRNAGAFVVVTGCYAQTDAEAAARFPGVDMVVGNDKKSRLFQLIEEKRARLGTSDAAGDATDQDAAEDRLDSDKSAPWMGLESAGYGARPVMIDPFAYGAVLPQGHTRAYLKIQEGCDRACSYCKIPMARGRGVSRAVNDVLSHVQSLEDAGVPEIVLTGVNLGWYRDRADNVRFGELVRRILGSLKTGRLRLSSIEPCDVDAELAELSLHPLFCDFLHVPLQSGSARILKAMRRTYSPVSFRKRIEQVKKINPSIFVGTDVIVGFPGETVDDFADTLSVCDDLEMPNIHAFRYSPRRGTPASELQGRPQGIEVKRRMNALRMLKEKHWQRYVESEKGKIRNLVVEKPRRLEVEGFNASTLPVSGQESALVGTEISGITDNFLRVMVNVETLVEKGNVIPVEVGPVVEPGIVRGFVRGAVARDTDFSAATR